MNLREDLVWQDLARCLDVDPEIFFPERGRSGRAARMTCGVCCVRAACLRYAIANREPFGIWGGATERDRREMRKAMADGSQGAQATEPGEKGAAA